MSKHSVAGKPGSDPTLPNVSLKLGGHEYHLAFSFNSIALVEKETGINLLKASLGEISAVTLRALLWAALLPENPDFTIERVGDLITMRNAAVAHQALVTAWFGSIEEPTDEASTSSGEAQAQAEVTA